MAVEIDFGMEKAEMKQLLARSKREPVNCAMGRGKDGAYLRLHKVKQPRKIEAELAKDFPDMKDVRWGTAFVDIDDNPKLVLFRVNKPASGLAKRLIKVVKQVGYRKVRFEFDDGSAAEDVEDEEAEGEEVSSEQTALPDADTLKPRLTALVQRIPQTLQLDPSRKLQLLELAKRGQGLIAAGDYAGTLAAVEDLEIAIEAPVVAKETISANTGAVAYGKSRLAWLAVRKQMQGDIDKLRSKLADTYKGTPLLAAIQTEYSARVSKRLEVLDESLADLLDDAMNADNPQKRASKVQAARDKIAEYQGVLQSEAKLFEDLDSNPFVPLSIMATLTKTLNTLSAAVR